MYLVDVVFVPFHGAGVLGYSSYQIFGLDVVQEHPSFTKRTR